MVYMKISAIGPQLYFNGSDKNYKEIVKEKSNTTLKLAIGTAVTGAGLLAVYYLSRGNKSAARAIGQKKSSSAANNIKPQDILNESSKNIFEKKSTKIEINRTYNGNIDKVKKIFYDNNGDKIKTQQAITELIYTMKIPTYYKRTITVQEKGKKPVKRITITKLDGKPTKTISNGENIYYFYDTNRPDKLLAHAFSKNGKFILKLENDKNFKKEFTDLESIYKWADGNFRNN